MSDSILDHGYIPEEHAPDPVISHGDPTPPGKVAIWMFLASEIMFFIAILGTYIILRSGSPELFRKFAGVLSKALGAAPTPGTDPFLAHDGAGGRCVAEGQSQKDHRDARHHLRCAPAGSWSSS